jgi:hypothetical protein
MADVVGTAFVRIKALTNQLAKDIEKDVKKGIKGADFEGAGKDIGDDIGDGVEDSLGKRKKGIADSIIPSESIKKNFDETMRDVQSRMKNMDLGVGIKDLPFDEGPIRNFFRRFRAEHDETAERIKAGGIGDSLDNISAKLKKLGAGSAPHFGLLAKGFVLIGGAITASLPFIQDLGAGILAYLTGLVAQVGFLSTAVVGGVAAMGAAIGSSLVAILPVILAFKAQSAALDDFKDTLTASGQEFSRIGVATQQTLLPALTDSLDVLEQLIPMFSEYGLFVGRAAGDFARLAANTLTGNVAQGRFQAILQSSLRILDILFPTLINIGDILSGIWVAAIPASERFVGSLANMVQNWRDLVNEGLRTGTLTETLDTWYDRAQLVGSALSNLTGALFDILQVGADESDSVFRRFDEWAERFRAFTSSEAGQNRIGLIFQNALAVMREVNAVAVELFDGIFGRLGEIGGVDGLVSALQKVQDVLPGLQEDFQDMLDVIDPIVRALASNIWEKFQKAVDELGDPLGRLATQMFELLEVMNDSGAFDVFLDLMKILADTLAVLLAIPGFGEFIAYFLAFNAAIKVAKIALGPFNIVFAGFLKVVADLYKLRAGKTLTDTASGLGRLAQNMGAFRGASGVASGITEVGAAAGGSAGKLSLAARGMGAITTAMPLIGAALAIGAGAFFVHQREVQEWQQEVREAAESLGLLNDGLLVTAEGIENYILEVSALGTGGNLTVLDEMGLSVERLSEHVAQGTLDLAGFVDTAVEAGQLRVQVGQGDEATFLQVESIQELQEIYALTNREVEQLQEGLSITATEAGELSANIDRLELAGPADEAREAFENLNKAIGQAAVDNIDAFIANATNIELLGPEFLDNLAEQFSVEGFDPEDAVAPMAAAMEQLGVEAERASLGIVGLDAETRRAIRAQAREAGSAAQQSVAEYELLRRESERLSGEIRDSLNNFNSDEFRAEFGEAHQAVLDFSQVVENTDLTNFNLDDGIDALVERFPEVGVATQNLFEQLSRLPEAEFNDAARAMGADADTLRGAMEGAMGAIQQLQDQAVSSLPTIGSLLDEATTTNEDGEQAFDQRGFLRAAQDRVNDTLNFGNHITDIQERFGDEAARLAVQQGPEAAAALASMTGTEGEQLNTVLEQMETAEALLRDHISGTLGPGIAEEYGIAADLIGSDYTIGLAAGINDPAALEALAVAGTENLNYLARGMQGRFVWEDGVLSFENTGTFQTTTRRNKNRSTTGAGGAQVLSKGGFVGNTGPFNNGPIGTDTIAAWLTPGEFVLRKAIAQAVPSGVLNSLNAGNPQLIAMLSGLNRPNTGVPASITATVAPGATRPAAAGVVIQQMNIAADTPLETARQITGRLKILQTQLNQR